MRIYEVFDNKSPCSYLSEQYQNNHYLFIKDCTPDYCSKLIKRGWRRFGYMFFRPICDKCRECQSLRIDVKNFNLTKSIKKSINRNRNTEVIIREPTITDEHLELFDKYHYFMHQKKGWKFTKVTSSHYMQSFVQGANDFGHEVAYYIDGKLVGVDLIDILEDGISAIYFYYDPDFPRNSLGVFSIYKEIEFAKQFGLDWIYLGYYVEHNSGLNYKTRYTPYQILEGRPEVDDNDIWC